VAMRLIDASAKLELPNKQGKVGRWVRCLLPDGTVVVVVVVVVVVIYMYMRLSCNVVGSSSGNRKW